ERAQVRSAALGTTGRMRRPAVAVVTAQGARSLPRRLMQGEAHLTIAAPGDMAALAAKKKRGHPPPVDEEDRLLPPGKRTIERIEQPPADHPPVAGGELFAHIDEVDRG